jgi:nicotinamidase/pyrazinamidase
LKSDSAGNLSTSERDALILVDLQNDFLPGGALAVPRGDEVIAVANRLQPQFKLAVATRDWHPAGHSSFAAAHPERQPGDIIQLDGLDQVLWPEHCVQGTRGAELAKGLAPLARRQEVFKGQDPQVDSYSGFFDNGHRRATGLHDLLQQGGVRRLFIMGLATDYCVKYTALDAVELGYQTLLVTDGCRGVEREPGDIERAVAEMRAAGVETIHSDDVPRLLATRAVQATDSAAAVERLAETPNLRFLRRGRWDFVSRRRGSGVVAIIAITPEDQLVLVEQYRPPVARRVIELPAGIVGDLPDTPDESIQDAALRELLEETGYRADRISILLSAPSSAGLTDEQVTFIRASGLQRVAAGGGDQHETIQVHSVPLNRINQWLRAQIDAGQLVDARVLTGLYLLHSDWSP